MNLAQDAVDFLVGAKLEWIEIAAQCARKYGRVFLMPSRLVKGAKEHEIPNN